MIDYIKREKLQCAIAALCAVLALLAFAGCGPSSDSGTEELVPTSTVSAVTRSATSPGIPENEVEDWLVFDDAEARCSFKYPLEAEIDTGRSRYGIYTIRLQFQMPDVSGYQGMVIQVVPIDDSTPLDDVLEQIYESGPHDVPFEEWLEESEDTTVGDFTAFKTTCSEGSSDFSVVVPRQDRVYVASPSHDMTATCVDPQALDLFYRVLETFIVK